MEVSGRLCSNLAPGIDRRKTQTARHRHNHIKRTCTAFDIIPLTGRTILAYSQGQKSRRQVLCATPQEQDAHGLFTLPTEVLYLVTEHLPPSSVVALGLACKVLHQTLDYELSDLLRRDWDLAVDKARIQCSAMTEEQRRSLQYITCDLRNEYNAAIQLIDRDLVPRKIMREYADPHGSATRSLYCSICKDLHPKNLFAPEQLSIDPWSRNCLAAQAPLPFCDHTTVTFVGLRRMLEAKAQVAPGKRRACDQSFTRICAHSACKNSFLVDWDCLRHAMSGLDLERDSISVNQASHDLEVMEAFKVCPHVTSGSAELWATYRAYHNSQVAVRPSQESYCHCCGISWNFRGLSCDALPSGST